MLYLTIKNPGVCPIEGLTTLGISTARGDADAIGQFGSGFKMAILTCLRAGLNPIIYLGREKVQFFSEPAYMGEKFYNKVLVKVGTKAPRELSIALEYGELDWTDVSMGLREFVSNALDAANGDVERITLKTVERIHPEEGCTIVGVPMSPEVQKFYSEIGTRFLQFGNRENTKKRLIEKDKPGPARIYRKGVLVRQLEGQPNSLFDYNFGDELRIDEARNLDDYSVVYSAAGVLCQDEEALGKVFKSLARGEQTWEAGFGDNYNVRTCAACYKDVWLSAWNKSFGATAVIGAEGMTIMLGAAAHNKGFKPIPINHTGWFEAMCKAGIGTLFSVLDNINDKGHELLPPTAEVLKTLKDTWDWLDVLKLTKGKTPPPVVLYREVMDGGSETMGYVKDSKVHIALGYERDHKVMLEEVSHYITGAMDCTRDFQDFAFRVAGAMMEV